MTNEEAIDELQWGYPKEDTSVEECLRYKQAIDMAISALSENKGDLISKGEVESVLHNNLHALIDTDQLYQLYKDINRLPTYSAENKGEWIPVSERLPDDGVWALFTDGKAISVERFKLDAENHFFPSGRWFELDKAIAWQPLPEPYKERGKK